jgi:hypothetical protein
VVQRVLEAANQFERLGVGLSSPLPVDAAY